MENINVIDGLVSIIMPSWNTAKFIAETIHLLLIRHTELGTPYCG